jgi:hypothetical protein
MNKKVLYILRQVMIAIIALQFLNLSVCSEAYWDNDYYDYSYTYNKTYDPTETAVEWIIEMKYGQQPAFSYDNHTETNKNIGKAFHCQIFSGQGTRLIPGRPEIKRPVFGELTTRIPCPCSEVISPPPESLA